MTNDTNLDPVALKAEKDLKDMNEKVARIADKLFTAMCDEKLTITKMRTILVQILPQMFEIKINEFLNKQEPKVLLAKDSGK